MCNDVKLRFTPEILRYRMFVVNCCDYRCDVVVVCVRFTPQYYIIITLMCNIDKTTSRYVFVCNTRRCVDILLFFKLIDYFDFPECRRRQGKIKFLYTQRREKLAVFTNIVLLFRVNYVKYIPSLSEIVFNNIHIIMYNNILLFSYTIINNARV